MLSNTLHTIVEAAVITELKDARRTHGDHFRSAHEGFGVLAEELHEARAELRDLESLIAEQLIENLHANDQEAMISDLSSVDLLARHLACEAIQLAAVARKYSETIAAFMEESAHA